MCVNKQFSFAFCITSSEQIPNAIILPFPQFNSHIAIAILDFGALGNSTEL